jgi:hypothetical protein
MELTPPAWMPSTKHPAGAKPQSKRHDKAALALEALGLLFGLHEEAPKFDSGDLRQDFVDVLTYQPSKPRQEMKNRVMPHVMVHAARNRAVSHPGMPSVPSQNTG